MQTVKILFIGDIIGSSGMRAVFSMLPSLKKKYQSDFVVANAENANDGFGITQQICENLFKVGVDVITTGNHAFHDIDEIAYYVKNAKRVLIPGNYPNSEFPYQFSLTFGDKTINIVNMQGRLNMNLLDCPFAKMTSFCKSKPSVSNINILDFHAESTAEKEAMALHLDGKVSAVIGTHTHVQTADERILKKGTAYITDCGAVRVLRSVIGYEYEVSALSVMGKVPQKHVPKEGNATVFGVALEIDTKTSKAVSIKRIAENSFV